MKKHIMWVTFAILLMIGGPWIAVTFARDNGMAVSFILFFAVNPIFSAACGAATGKDIKTYWWLPVITACAFLAGTWIFFDMGESAFILYSGCYLAIGLLVMFVRALVNRKKLQKYH